MKKIITLLFFTTLLTTSYNLFVSQQPEGQTTSINDHIIEVPTHTEKRAGRRQYKKGCGWLKTIFTLGAAAAIVVNGTHTIAAPIWGINESINKVDLDGINQAARFINTGEHIIVKGFNCAYECKDDPNIVPCAIQCMNSKEKPPRDPK